MNLLFEFKNTYIVHHPIDLVREELRKLTERKWYDFFENIVGRLHDNDTFKFKPKFTFGYIKVFGFPQSLSYLTGSIEEEGNKTLINATARPSYAMVIFLYLLLSLVVLKLFDINIPIEGSVSEVSVALLSPGAALAAVMVFGAVRIRNRFERLMDLKRLE